MNKDGNNYDSSRRKRLVGRKISKQFADHGEFVGQIKQYDPTSQKFHVEYQDGDLEELSEADLLPLLLLRTDSSPSHSKQLFQKKQHPTNTEVFFSYVVPILLQCGWTIQKHLYIQPGCSKETGKYGVDYFDTVEQVLYHVASLPSLWNACNFPPQIHDFLAASLQLNRGTSKSDSGEFTNESVFSQSKRKNSSSSILNNPYQEYSSKRLKLQHDTANQQKLYMDAPRIRSTEESNRPVAYSHPTSTLASPQQRSNNNPPIASFYDRSMEAVARVRELQMPTSTKHIASTTGPISTYTSQIPKRFINSSADSSKPSIRPSVSDNSSPSNYSTYTSIHAGNEHGNYYSVPTSTATNSDRHNIDLYQRNSSDRSHTKTNISSTLWQAPQSSDKHLYQTFSSERNSKGVHGEGREGVRPAMLHGPNGAKWNNADNCTGENNFKQHESASFSQPQEKLMKPQQHSSAIHEARHQERVAYDRACNSRNSISEADLHSAHQRRIAIERAYLTSKNSVLPPSNNLTPGSTYNARYPVRELPVPLTSTDKSSSRASKGVATLAPSSSSFEEEQKVPQKLGEYLLRNNRYTSNLDISQNQSKSQFMRSSDTSTAEDSNGVYEGQHFSSLQTRGHYLSTSHHTSSSDGNNNNGVVISHESHSTKPFSYFRNVLLSEENCDNDQEANSSSGNRKYHHEHHLHDGSQNNFTFRLKPLRDQSECRLRPPTSNYSFSDAISSRSSSDLPHSIKDIITPTVPSLATVGFSSSSYQQKNGEMPGEQATFQQRDSSYKRNLCDERNTSQSQYQFEERS